MSGETAMLSKRELMKLDFPPAPWSWANGNGYNSNTYIFYGYGARHKFDFMEIPEDSDFMAINEDKLAKFICRVVNSHDALIEALEQSCVELEEAAKVFAGTGYKGLAGILMAAVGRNKSTISIAKGEDQ